MHAVASKPDATGCHRHQIVTALVEQIPSAVRMRHFPSACRLRSQIHSHRRLHVRIHAEQIARVIPVLDLHEPIVILPVVPDDLICDIRVGVSVVHIEPLGERVQNCLIQATCSAGSSTNYAHRCGKRRSDKSTAFHRWPPSELELQRAHSVYTPQRLTRKRPRTLSGASPSSFHDRRGFGECEDGG